MFKPELLSPAGSKEAFLAALCGGADAIYLAGDRFGARAYADNFHTEDLLWAISYAHLFGVKVYLTCNTLTKEEELKDVIAFMEPLYNGGLDGVIIQDLGVFSILKSHFPGLYLHASTQMAITGIEGAKLLKSLGASRIVPARELTLEEIRRIKESVDIELECFIHGAMCYSYSGACLYSAALGDRSGNRGRCAGPCRLEYNSFGKDAYILSMRDMCSLQLLPELVGAGIDSFKIEGRMKRPEYVYGVTGIYRKYLDQVLKGDGNFRIFDEDLELLKHLYLRSRISTGYYHKLHGKDMLTLEKPGYNETSDALLKKMQTEMEERKPLIPVTGRLLLKEDEAATFTLSSDQASVTVKGENVTKAVNRPLTKEELDQRMRKLGGTIFKASSMEICMEGNVFLPVGALNELRREAASRLEQELWQTTRLN